MCAASEAMRGSTPLDVAASSVMDNNGLALALEEPDLEKVCSRVALLKNGLEHGGLTFALIIAVGLKGSKNSV